MTRNRCPPTSFFDKSAAEVADGDDGNDDAADLESILDEALAAAVPLHRLTGHYRSRHESLIAFSNYRYYGGSLVTYPSSDTRESAVVLRRIDGVYARGKTRTNPLEAQAIVEEILRRLRDPTLSRLSIGVVTLNSQQQQLILNLLDQAIRADADLSPYFDDENPDHVFVKNLETVQGDQRDVILLSLTYGPTEPGGRTMAMNFGPLNKSGGERRLNVAVTRATTEVVVFASFDAGMVDLSRTSAQAVEDLKNYLDFAARGPIALAQAIVSIGGQTAYESDFEMAVAEGLRRHGWDVRTQIGASKFRIDLGIVHPDSPGRFLAGVECDGASYHSSPSARDRDRVRHAILIGLGWKLVRVWSTDWFIDPRERLQRLDESLTTLLAESRATAKTDVEAPDHEPLTRPVRRVAGHADVSTTGKGIDDQTPKDAPGFARDPSARDDSGLGSEGQADADADTLADAGEASTDEAWEGSQGDEASPLAQRFYSDGRYLPEIARMATDMVDGEGPVRLDRVVRQIARAHGFARTGKLIRDRVTKALGRKRPRSKDANAAEVLWPEGTAPSTVSPWRGLRFSGIERTWREVPDAEMRDLARRIVEEGHEDPVRAFAEVLELGRLTAGTKAELEKWLAWVRRRNSS